MYYKFLRFVNDHSVEIIKTQSLEKEVIDPSKTQFYLKRFVINPKYIPENTDLHNYENSKYALEISSELYLLQILNVDSKGLIKCRTVDMPMKQEALHLDQLIWFNDLSKVKDKVSNKLVGEYVLCVKNQYKHILMALKSDLWKKTNCLDLIWNKEGTSKIEVIQEGLIWAKLENGNKVWSYFPLFLSMNKFSHDTDQESLVGKDIVVYTISNSYYFKLKSLKKIYERKLSLEQFNHDFGCEVEPRIEYSNNKILDRIKCTDFPHVFDKPEFNLKESFISHAGMNKNLASVIGLGIFEHLVRFKSDYHFKSFIESLFTKSKVDHLYKDFTLLNNCKNAKNFHKKLGEKAIDIKRIGEGVLSLLKNDIETFEGLQELCDLIGCCIHLRNFTEGFKQIKIVPTHYIIKRRPIINLGKYFNDYFLIYSQEVMKADKFLDLKVKTKRNFPYYDEDFEKEENLFKDFLKKLLEQVKAIRGYLDKKLSGLVPEIVKYDFENEAKLYAEYYCEKYNDKTGGVVANELKNLSFSDVFYKLTGKKYFCSCGCIQYLDEASNLKKSCVCKRDYSRQHLLRFTVNEPCICQTMRVQDILALP